MDAVLECCCGLDVHRDSIVACLLKGSLTNKPESTLRTFSSLPHGLQQLREWLVEENCRHVAMESTGVYWQPVFETLEDAFDSSIVLMVVNAHHMRNVPGRKTDMKDAQWIAMLLRAGLLKSSFIPNKLTRELRDLTRYRKSLVQVANAQKNRIEKFLQSSGFKLSSFMSDIFGVSGQAIMAHLSCYGEISVELLDTYLKGTLRKKKDDVALAVAGKLSVHQRHFLATQLKHLHQMELSIQEIEADIHLVLVNFQKEIELLDSIPGLDITAAAAIIAEIGTDMSKFPTSEHLCSWAGLSPGDNESAGKKKSVRTNKGNRHIKQLLCEIAWCITRIRKTYLSNWYWKIKQRRGAKKAIIALSRKLLTIIYAVIKNDNNPFKEELYEQQQQRQLNHRQQKMIKELTKQGFEVIPKGV